MNIFKALAVKDVDEATQAIPLTDVGPALRAEPGALEGAARDVRRACETVGFFNVDAVIECLPTCVSAGDPPHYPRAVYRDLVLQFYNANYFHRKDYAGAAAGS